jgi:uncharacterized protein YdeI (YjbR/CyaY-like superfamily)
MKAATKNELPVLPFSSQAEWRSWLEIHHAMSDGIWLKMYKKGSGIPTVVYAEALDEALCYGWIDGQLKAGDEKFYLQRFTPRRAKSTWSKRNIRHVERLEKEDKMTPSGWKVIEAARADGRWDNAYDSHSNMQIPDLLADALARNPQMAAFFGSLDKNNRYAIVWRIQSAKNDTIRERRLKTLLEMLARGEKLHP